MLDENGNLTNQEPNTSNPPEPVIPQQQPQSSNVYNAFPAQPIEPAGSAPVAEVAQQTVFNTIPVAPKKPGIPKVAIISIAVVLAIAAGVAGFFIFQNMNKSESDKSNSLSNSTSTAGWGNLSGTEVQKSIFREILTTSYGEKKAKEIANSWTLTDEMQETPEGVPMKNGSTRVGQWELTNPDEGEGAYDITLIKEKLGEVTYSLSLKIPLASQNYVAYDTVLAGDMSWVYQDLNPSWEEDVNKVNEAKSLAEKIVGITYPTATVGSRIGSVSSIDKELLSPGNYEYTFTPRGGINIDFSLSGIGTVYWYTEK